MSNGRDSSSQRGLRDRVSFFEKVWSGSTSSDTVDATADVEDIEKRIEQRKRTAESPKIEVKLRHTESPSRSIERTESPATFAKLRHVEPAEEIEGFERQVEEGDLAAGVRFVKFERMTVRRTVTETRSDVTDRPDSPQHEWYSEYRHQALHNAPRVEYVRSKSEYDSHIAEIRVLFVCSVQCLQLDNQASTRRPRVTKYSKTTIAPGGTTEPVTERSLMTATYRLYGGGGETCILLTVDALIDISYVTKLNERADANTFVPNNAKVEGVCKDGDAETLVLSFKEFALEWTFLKTPGGERWYVDGIRLSYNSSARILEHAAKQGRRVSLNTAQGSLLFPTPVGKSFYCPEETTVDLIEGEGSSPSGHRAKLYLRQMRLQAFMFKRDGEFGPPWHCSDSSRVRSETAPVAVGAALAIATAGTLVGYAIWRYLKVKKVQYDTME